MAKPEKKYQVFVSSTYLDLMEERQKVMYALLELDCIPSGMELFPAADLSQWELIQGVIDECDYYLVVVGGRYGSIPPAPKGTLEPKSYTQMEYEYAVLKQKPVIAFLHRDPGSLPESKKESTIKGQEKLGKFREIVQQRMVAYWTSPDNLAARVTASLVRLIEQNPAAGWIRGDLSGVLYDELASLETQLRREKINHRVLRAGRWRSRTTPLLKIVQSIANEHGRDISTVKRFMNVIEEEYDADAANLIYWWLLVHGVFRFSDLSPWFDDNGQNWKKSIAYVELTERGKMLLQKLGNASLLEK
jgi:hypothetical protein